MEARTITALLSSVLIACGGATSPPDAGRVGTDSGPRADSGPPGMMIVPAGDVMGTWCGTIQVQGNVTVPAGQTLVICAGSMVSFAASAGMSVQGTLRIDGSSGGRVSLTGAGGMRWNGLVIEGTLAAEFTDITAASLAIRGGSSSTITFNDGTISARGNLQSLVVENGGTVDRTLITEGNSVSVNGGVLSMTDTTVDFMHPASSPDCIDVSDGGLMLSHVRITGCHCTLHITNAPAGITVNDSILDDNAYGAMIAFTSAQFHRNNILAANGAYDDIGRSPGAITADVTNNYYGGGNAMIHASSAPTTDMAVLNQFTGRDAPASAPFAEAGPR
jgi:hypothetical protein